MKKVLHALQSLEKWIIVIAFVIMVGVLWLFRNANPHKVTRRFRIAQTASAAA